MGLSIMKFYCQCQSELKKNTNINKCYFTNMCFKVPSCLPYTVNNDSVKLHTGGCSWKVAGSRFRAYKSNGD